jgi:hypothetical protein
LGRPGAGRGLHAAASAVLRGGLAQRQTRCLRTCR